MPTAYPCRTSNYGLSALTAAWQGRGESGEVRVRGKAVFKGYPTLH